jgi:hypothetical protein
VQRHDRIEPAVHIRAAGKTNLVDATFILSKVIYDLEQFFRR